MYKNRENIYIRIGLKITANGFFVFENILGRDALALRIFLLDSNLGKRFYEYIFFPENCSRTYGEIDPLENIDSACEERENYSKCTILKLC